MIEPIAPLTLIVLSYALKGLGIGLLIGVFLVFAWALSKEL